MHCVNKQMPVLQRKTELIWCAIKIRTLCAVNVDRNPVSNRNSGLLLLLFNTTRMVPGPPSTGVAIAMDGGMADTTCYYTGR